MSTTTKVASNLDGFGTLKGAYNDVDATISTNGFLVGKVGHKVTVSTASNVSTYTFSDSGTTLYVLTLTYTDGTLATLVSAERTA